jgi:hypothetical protein
MNEILFGTVELKCATANGICGTYKKTQKLHTFKKNEKFNSTTIFKETTLNFSTFWKKTKLKKQLASQKTLLKRTWVNLSKTMLNISPRINKPEVYYSRGDITWATTQKHRLS